MLFTTYNWFVRAYSLDSDTDIDSLKSSFIYNPFNIEPILKGDIDDDSDQDGSDITLFVNQLALGSNTITIEEFAAQFGK